MNIKQGLRPVLAITAVVYALVGLYLLAGGIWLTALGGSLYYLIAGALLLVTAVLLLRRRQEALWVYAALLIGTMVWAVGEVGLDFWALAPRGDILVPLGIWLMLPPITRNLGTRDLAPPSRAAQVPLGLAVGAAVVVVVAALTQDPQDIAGSLPQVAQNAPTPGDAGEIPDEDWQAYGRTGFGDRFSPLKQITPDNVHNLKVAWTFRTGDVKGPHDPGEFTDETTPIKIRDTVYLCSPHQILFALDAATGKLKWKFDPKLTLEVG